MGAKETRIDRPGQLHRLDGVLNQSGWATSPLLRYRRSAVKASRWRIKEWDYYLVNDDEYAVALTLSDLGYIGLVSASLVDFAQAAYTTTSVVTPFPLGRFHLPESSSSGVSEFENSRVSFRFEAKDGVRSLRAYFAHFDGDDDLTFEAVLDEEPQDSMVIATPWKEDPQAFYYNQKIIGMRARGSFKKGMLIHGFNPTSSFGLLDWGRGVWTRDNTWFWGAAQGWQDGRGGCAPDTHRFGLNMGYGFGDTSAASENIVFVDGIGHKLGRLVFDIPEKRDGAGSDRLADRYELMEPWHIVDEDGRVDLTFSLVLDRADYMDYKLIRSDQHQVFGVFDGTVVLDDGGTFTVSDLQGSAEVVHNVY